MIHRLYILCCVFTSCLVAGQSTQYALRGQSFTLDPAIPEAPDDILWKHKGNKVVDFNGNEQNVYGTFQNRISLDWHSAALSISDLSYEDSGAYALEAYRNKELKRSFFKLEVIDRVSKPTISCEMNNGNSSVKPENRATLKCSVEPRQSPSLTTFEWSSSEKPQLGEKLPILLGPEHDDKVYNCIVRNPLTKETAAFTAKECYPAINSAGLTAGICVAVAIALILAMLGVFFCKKKQKAGFAKDKTVDEENSMEFGVEERPKKVLTGNVTELILKFDPDNPKLRAKGSVVEKRTQKGVCVCMRACVRTCRGSKEAKQKHTAAPHPPDPAGNDKREPKFKERQNKEREPLLNNQNPAGNDKPEPEVKEPQEKEHDPSLNDQSKNTKCNLQTSTATEQPGSENKAAQGEERRLLIHRESTLASHDRLVNLNEKHCSSPNSDIDDPNLDQDNRQAHLAKENSVDEENTRDPAVNDKPEPEVKEPQEKEPESSLNDQSVNTKCDLQTSTATQQPVPVSEVAEEAGEEAVSPPAHDAAPPAVRPRLASDSSSQDVAGEHRDNPSSDQGITGGTFEEGDSSEPEDIDKSEDKTGLENTEGGPSDSEKASKLLDDQSKDEMSNLQSSPVSEQSESKKEEGEGKESTSTPTDDVPSSMTKGSPTMAPQDDADEQGKDASSVEVTGKTQEENADDSVVLSSNNINEYDSPSDVQDSDPNPEDKGAETTDEQNLEPKQTQAGEDDQQDRDQKEVSEDNNESDHLNGVKEKPTISEDKGAETTDEQDPKPKETQAEGDNQQESNQKEVSEDNNESGGTSDREEMEQDQNLDSSQLPQSPITPKPDNSNTSTSPDTVHAVAGQEEKDKTKQK